MNIPTIDSISIVSTLVFSRLFIVNISIGIFGVFMPRCGNVHMIFIDIKLSFSFSNNVTVIVTVTDAVTDNVTDTVTVDIAVDVVTVLLTVVTVLTFSIFFLFLLLVLVMVLVMMMVMMLNWIVVLTGCIVMISIIILRVVRMMMGKMVMVMLGMTIVAVAHLIIFNELETGRGNNVTLCIHHLTHGSHGHHTGYSNWHTRDPTRHAHG